MGAGALFLERASPPYTWWSGFGGDAGEREFWMLCGGGRHGVERGRRGSGWLLTMALSPVYAQVPMLVLRLVLTEGQAQVFALAVRVE